MRRYAARARSICGLPCTSRWASPRRPGALPAAAGGAEADRGGGAGAIPTVAQSLGCSSPRAGPDTPALANYGQGLDYWWRLPYRIPVLTPESIDWQPALDRAAAGERLDEASALALLPRRSPRWGGGRAPATGSIPSGTAPSSSTGNINYTNVCLSGCRFCAFYCSPAPDGLRCHSSDSQGGGCLLGATQIMIQAGYTLTSSFPGSRIRSAPSRRASRWSSTRSPRRRSTTWRGSPGRQWRRRCAACTRPGWTPSPAAERRSCAMTSATWSARASVAPTSGLL
jgi:hypothetical protein